MIQLLISYAAKAALLLALAGGLAALMGRAEAAVRHLLWVVGLAAALLVLPLSLLLPELPLGLAEPGEAGTAINLLLLLGLAGAGLLLARIAADQFALRRLAVESETIAEEHLLALAEASAAQLGVRRAVRLRRWTGASPATFGTLRPTILLPAGSEAWPLERAKLVLLHEMAHVARFDAGALMLARIVGALHWFNPLSRWAMRRIRTECEQACDDLVLRAGADPATYARTLLETMQDSGSRAGPVGALSMTAAEGLEARLACILAGQSRRARFAKPVAAAAAVAIVGGALLLAPLGLETAGADAYSTSTSTAGE